VNRDRVIDDVACALTDAEPAASMRTRVLAAIGGEPQHRRRVAPAVVLAAAAGVVVALAAGAGVWRTEPPRRDDVGGIARVEPPAVVPIEPGATAKPEATLVGGRSPATSRGGVAPTAEEVAWLGRAVPALAPPAALLLDDIQPFAVVTPLLDVTPLDEARPIDVAPLSIEPVAGGG
jgi:hypothetical protein